jgi:hypothetical protein
LGANAERPQPQRGAKPGLRRPQGERANAGPKFGRLRGERFGPRSRFAGPQNEHAAGKPGRFGAGPAERRPFRDQPEFESGPRARFERPRFASRPRQTDQEVSFEESPRGAIRPSCGEAIRPSFREAIRQGIGQKPRRQTGQSLEQRAGQSPEQGDKRPASQAGGFRACVSRRGQARRFSKTRLQSQARRPKARGLLEIRLQGQARRR